jgi:uncharacterized hydrophobic protein (TIGR00341 family)
MQERLLEVIIPVEQKEKTLELLSDYSLKGLWYDRISQEKYLVRILMEAEKVEALSDKLQQHFTSAEGFKIIVLPVEAVIPQFHTEEKDKEKAESTEQKQPGKRVRISREELYADIINSSKLTWIFVVAVIISSIVASIGLLKDSVAIIIGAMVIAPLLGPNVALSLATTLADYSLVKHSIKTLLSGIMIAVILSLLIGVLLPVHPDSREIASRTQVDLADLVLALGSGTAGVLAYTTGVSTSLIGVMVAVALLPPLVNFGLLMGSGHPGIAFNAFLLFTANLICINLSGVLTFLIQGIRPRTWWEAQKAKRSTYISIIIWALLFLVLVFLIIR